MSFQAPTIPNNPVYGYNELTALTTVSGTIPLDDTIPQNTEGDQILSASITLKKATSKVFVAISIYGLIQSGGAFLTVATFRDSGVDAIDAWSVRPAVEVYTWTKQFIDSPGASGTYTYKVRAGCNTGNIYLNGHGVVNRDFGGVSKCTLSLMEVLA